MIAIPATAGAASTTTNCGSMTESGGCVTPTVPPAKPPAVLPTSQLPATSSISPTVAAPSEPSTTSLPFTGADVEELAVIGLGAVLAGGVLIRRRRNPAL